MYNGTSQLTNRVMSVQLSFKRSPEESIWSTTTSICYKEVSSRQWRQLNTTSDSNTSRTCAFGSSREISRSVNTKHYNFYKGNGDNSSATSSSKTSRTSVFGSSRKIWSPSSTQVSSAESITNSTLDCHIHNTTYILL